MHERLPARAVRSLSAHAPSAGVAARQRSTVAACNGTNVDYARNSDTTFTYDRCIAWINIKPW
jgi:hypothetical protein